MKHDLKTTEKRLRKNFNKFIQMRDVIIAISGEIIAKCIACSRSKILNNTYDWKEFHASHYWLENEYASVRFDEENVNGCCGRCNKFLSGNLAQYEVNLIDKIGNESFQKLNFRRNQIKKFNVIEIDEMNKHYLEAIKYLKRTKFGNTFISNHSPVIFWCYYKICYIVT